MTPIDGNDELSNAIAIIGMSGRFPGAKNLDEFWRNLRDGVESISFFSDEELRKAGVDPAARRDPTYVAAGGTLEGVDLFDAGFFGFNPREAEAMDPQQRVFLEVAWEALENSGYDPAKYPGSIGVFAGTGISTYFLYNIYDNKELLNLLGGHQAMIGNDKDHLATHASYKFNLRGPSLTVQTACSTSLVAVCMACRSLLDYQCDMALAGGASIAIPQGVGYYYREGGIASPDGHCRAFDSEARGTVAGNGAGVVFLKRLSDAIADGDNVRAVIRGTAINNDGSVKVGYTAPSVDGQAEVVAMAQATAAVDPATITYIEAHGTGTPLGDPIEIAALAQVFSRVDRKHRCAIGSVKSNIGHLDTAAGVAGLIKAVLALENKTIPASLHFKHANPKLNLERTPFYISHRTHDWATNGSPRRAGVSSFGIGGTNAHVVLEEGPVRESALSKRPAHLLLLSARSSAAIDAMAESWSDHFRQHPEINLAEAAFTSAIGRKEFRHRRAVICSNLADASDKLLTSQTKEAGQREIAFLFSGQGSQYAGMTRELYDSEPAYRARVDQCLDILRRIEGVDLFPALFPDASQATSLIDETEYTQLALFVIEYALASVLIDWSVKPFAMVGHSIGEYTAACIAGVWTLEEALSIVCTRGRLMQSMPRGAMLATRLAEHDAQRWLGRGVSLAAINARDQCVLSGPHEEIERIATELGSLEAQAVKLRTSHAFHSEIMDPILKDFEDAVRRTNLRAPSIPFLSNTTGDWITDSQATDPSYWSRHLREPVRFADSAERLLSHPGASMVEIGPGQILAGLVRRHPGYTPSTPLIQLVRESKDQRSDIDVLLSAVGRMWTEGAPVNWSAFYGTERRSRIPLPTYPFERKRYWIDAPAKETAAKRTYGRTADVADWFYIPRWQRADPIPGNITIAGQRWLVFTAGDVGNTIADVLRRRGGIVDTFDIAGDVTQETYDSVIARCAPDAVVHCGLADTNTRSFEEWQGFGFHSVLRLSRSLARAVRKFPIVVNVVSRNLYSVIGSEQLEPSKTTVLGPCRVVPQEHSGIRIRNIDIDETRLPQSVEALVSEMIAPITEPVVSMRFGRRWLPVFEHAHWEEAPDRSLLRKEGVYLITGGFGNVGITIAETLARHFNARLALVGRTPLPAETEWDGTSTRSLRAVRELRGLGAEVLPICCDCANADQMRSALAETIEHLGRIDGVIHAAGEMSPEAFQPFTATDETTANLHFNNKVKSALVLRDLLPERPVPFCMLVSSLSSVLGGLNFSAYAGANAALDCLADQQNQDSAGTRWISVNWDGWRFTENQPAHHEYFLMPNEGASAFRRILSHARSHQVVVSTGDLETRLAQWVRLQSTTPEPVTHDLAPAHPRPEVATKFAAPQTAVEQMIADVWQLVLGVSEVGVNDNFFELGGHSLLAIQLISRLRDLFQAEIALTAIFDHPTLAQLAAHIEAIPGNDDAQMSRLSEMLDYVEQLSPEEVEALLAREAQL